MAANTLARAYASMKGALNSSRSIYKSRSYFTYVNEPSHPIPSKVPCWVKNASEAIQKAGLKSGLLIIILILSQNIFYFIMYNKTLFSYKREFYKLLNDFVYKTNKSVVVVCCTLSINLYNMCILETTFFQLFFNYLICFKCLKYSACVRPVSIDFYYCALLASLIITHSFSFLFFLAN